MSVNSKKGYLNIENREDRAIVANILFKNGYSVSPVKVKKDGRSFTYLVGYDKKDEKSKDGELIE